MNTDTTTAHEIAMRIDADTAVARWKDWRWQVGHSVRSIETFERALGITFPPEERAELERTVERFPLCVTPYYLSLIDPEDFRNDPVFMQCFPSVRELEVEDYDLEDPLAEDADMTAPCITHRYPDRVLFLVSNLCAMYCRHCTRKRKVGDIDSVPADEEIEAGLAYIREHPRVRDVLLSGGDPLMLPDETLDRILTELDAIEHVEVVRIGTRVPVVLPYRITADLARMLGTHHPLWINTHFNHPKEITSSSEAALSILADAGIPLGNQTVLLANVNDCPRLQRTLAHKLVRNRVRPYYLYQCDLSEGLSHFRTSVARGIEIVENLVGHTSGFAVPTYVVDAPGGGGKIPLMPTYVLSWADNKVVLRNYEGVITTYQEPKNYCPVYCDGNCAECTLQLKEENAEEPGPVGIAKILSDLDETSSLVPENTERMERRIDA
ncbi:lysine 2,3-aminomutase [Methanofollis formosanus]|uniref:L-lysine 2,3-aminomutase n=1 Tax=Methanofollis formosanus TaxID=299308 RepID=A0A8G1A1M3_9EURY|nr:lysine 2,3-aminomutase [Methanofollis formosanus]QYZ78880.1 lysine 2,3-aminomutase [Methanofollis formosanus]